MMSASVIEMTKKISKFQFSLLQLREIKLALKLFQAQENDIFLVTAPKSGTTWLKAVLYALINREACHPHDPHHPLLNQTPHQLVPWLEFAYLSGDDSEGKIVYLCRDIKDTFVSLFHFSNRINYLLFMRYEEMQNEPLVQLRRLAYCLGRPFFQEEENSENDFFFRSGLVGDWKNYLTTEMGSKLDQITEEKFKGTGLSMT
ncbi:hypothetical protein DCAR_0102694 [Daucus carota subsp. sativus]|uniref:Sulfotransferase n=1 Tax=Daucus carota subsp. sativus TaxID=79200 RepID=A0AAF1AI99_DAUCS|nr:hypothetical protein DCAR_0102694 [Daucus carota subsp. sativus]